MSDFMTGLKTATNYGYTENGGVKHMTTDSDVLDMFAMGGAYRSRSDEDVILMFQKAFAENETLALKCLFYLRDCREGQGERRFFRVCIKWAADHMPEAMARNIENIPFYGRWDDLYALVGTKCENDAFSLMRKQLALDVTSKTPSLLAKWLKSENTSSAESRALATKTRQYLGWTSRQYRKTLSALRARINIVERLMSENRWDEIEFDKIPSKAGFIYRNAFARRDIIKAKYEAFAKDENTTVNADTLYPYEVVAQAYKLSNSGRWGWGYDSKCTVPLDNTERLMINKYWDNLKDYFDGCTLDALCVVDTSGSMCSYEANAPINVAISLGLYAAEKARGPFHGHYVSFSSRPQLIETAGVDFVDKVHRIYSTNLCENTNIEATFDLLLRVAQTNYCSQADLPQNIVIISDMEFDMARGQYGWYHNRTVEPYETVLEGIARKWEAAGYQIPNLIFWNVAARNNNIPMKPGKGITFVSGFSPVIFKQIMEGKTALDLMLETLNSPRYERVK